MLLYSFGKKTNKSPLEQSFLSCTFIILIWNFYHFLLILDDSSLHRKAVILNVVTGSMLELVREKYHMHCWLKKNVNSKLTT